MVKKRKLLTKIGKWLDRDEILIISGPRRVGKTTLLQLIKNELLTKGIEDKRIISLNLEDIDVLRQLNKSPKELLKFITRQDKKSYFLIDEIQYLDDASNFLKYLFDMHRDKIKLIVTGSFMFEVKSRFRNSLVGRKIEFDMTPLVFDEFVRFKDETLLPHLFTEEVPGHIHEQFLGLLEEYLIFGGLPEIVLTRDREMKQTLLKEYVNTYLKKDIRYIWANGDILKYNDLLTIISSQVSSLLNISEIANTIRLPRRKTEEYLDTLLLSSLIYLLPPYFSNIRSQIVKMKKIFLFDTGIRNQLIRNFNGTSSRSDAGVLFENFLLNEFLNVFEKDCIYFFRTRTGTEIDFIIKREKVLPIEVKYKRLEKTFGTKPITYFAGESDIDKAYLVNLILNRQPGKEHEKIEFIDFRRFLKKLYEKDI